MQHKILYSPGFGAGWSTWHYGANHEQRVFLLTYPPLIEAIENGDDIGYNRAHNTQHFDADSVLDGFVKEWTERWGDEDIPYLGGARDLTVMTVNGPFRVDEYDDNESVIEQSQQGWINLDD